MTVSQLMDILSNFNPETELVLHREDEPLWGQERRVFGEELESVKEVSYNRVYSPTGNCYAKTEPQKIVGLTVKLDGPKFLKVR